MYHRHKVSAQSVAISRPEYGDDELSSDDVDGQEGEALDDEDETEPKPSTPDDPIVFAPRSPQPVHLLLHLCLPPSKVLLTVDFEDHYVAPSATDLPTRKL
jgi:hypothetical protein